MRKHINDFTMRVGSSNNILIATLRENSFIHAGPLRQKRVRSVYILFITTVVIVCLYGTLFYVLCFMYNYLFCILWAGGPEIKLSSLLLIRKSVQPMLHKRNMINLFIVNLISKNKLQGVCVASQLQDRIASFITLILYLTVKLT